MQYELTPDKLTIFIATGDRSDLEHVLGELLASAITAPRLELVGNTTHDKLFVLGAWRLDGATTKTRSLFRGLAEQRVFERLGVTHLHLRGACTAATERGRKTLATLAEILGITVTGEPGLACLREPPPARARSLDLDSLPARSIDSHARRVTLDDARAILQLVRRTEGTELPGLLALPHATLALPSYIAGAYHTLDVLLDHEYVRLAGDLVFPVADPCALHALLDEISSRRDP